MDLKLKGKTALVTGASAGIRLQKAPELRFLEDVGVDMSEKLAAIVREDEQKAREAGRDGQPEDDKGGT